MTQSADAIVVGAGLAGLVAAAELADAGKRVLVLDQEGEQNIGGQAFWSFGGLFLVDSPEQRRLGIRDSRELALADWMNTAGFDRPEDHWPRRWAERGRKGVLGPFVQRVRKQVRAGRITLLFRHRVTGLTMTAGAVAGVSGEVLEPSDVLRRERSSQLVGDFAFEAGTVVTTSGGIGGNHELVRRHWPTERLDEAPAFMVPGVPAHVDRYMRGVVEASGGRVINPDRMWHYTEGLRNHTPVWENHGIRVLPGPSSLWLSPHGDRLPFPNYPGFDTLRTLTHITTHGYPYTWFLLNEKIIQREFALSGSEQNPDLTGKDLKLVIARVRGVQAPVRAFMDHGEDFVVRRTLKELTVGMQELTGDALLDPAAVEREVRARDAQIANAFGKDAQLAAVRGARAFLGDRLSRVAKPGPILDPAAGPLIAVRMNVLTRKSLGGLETDLQGRVLDGRGQPIAGLYAAGEVSGFGGGGVHGYRSLEGTFLGGCIFGGRVAGRAVAAGV